MSEEQVLVGDVLRVCAHTKRGTPFFSNDFCKARDAGFREAVVGLTAGGN